MSSLLPIDLDALLVALVLDPATYSRNRFFELYKASDVRRVRRRAMQIRSIVGHVARTRRSGTSGAVSQTSAPEGRTKLSYVLPWLSLRRTALLDELEMCLVRVALGRIHASEVSGALASLLPTDADRIRIEATLARLAPASLRPPVEAPPLEQLGGTETPSGVPL